MSDNVTKWLEQLGLGQYAEAFEQSAIGLDHLPDLDHETLKEIGVPVIGHRMSILKAAAKLRPSIESDSQVEAKAAESGSEVETNLAAWERHPGERKPVTMLFADVTGSTAFTESLDAEETHELLYGATQKMCEAVERHRGTVCRFMGDGIMAMFGAPIASEYHAVDACEAALEMQQAIRKYASEIELRYGSSIQIRVGLHSGEVVVLTIGEGDNIEYDASGPTVPIAARMEQSAESGDVYLTAATQSLAGGRLETQALDPISVKGISEPLPIFVLHAVRSIEEAATLGARTPFVGRRAELNQFRGILEACIEEGQGQTVYVRGEPGIGKTRLIEEFGRIAAEQGVLQHRVLVLPFGVGKGQDAIRSLLRSLLEISSGGDEHGRERAVQDILSDERLEPDQVVFLNDLLDLPQSIELRAQYDAMDNATRNEGKRVVMSSLVTTISTKQPVLIMVEDVHWADTITLAHLASLTKTVADCPAILVMTSRIEGDNLDHSWRVTVESSPFLTIDLGPLRARDSVALISRFIDVSDPVAKNCIERAAGNPLFLEQLLRTAQEGLSGTLPESIQSMVLARLDRLDPIHKRALQTASVIGQRFDLNLLRHLLQKHDYDCSELVEHNLIRPEESGYLFAHALVQESVYGSLLKRLRNQLHSQAAEWFKDSDLTLYARHLDYAGDERACGAYLEAAREQIRQYRYETAFELISRGLTLNPAQSKWHSLTCLKAELLLETGEVESSMAAYHEALEHTVDDMQRCDAWMGMAACKRITTGYERALELLAECEPLMSRSDDALRRSRLHHLRGNVYFPLGKVDDCHAEHQRALENAQAAGSAEDEARALGGLGDAAYARGRMRSAFEMFQRCVDRCREHGYGRIEVANVGQMAFTLTFLGQCERSLKETLDAAQAANRVSHLRAEINARSGICRAAFELGNAEMVESNALLVQEIGHKLKARAWDLSNAIDVSMGMYLQNKRSEARQLLETAIDNDSTPTFSGGQALGLLAVVSDNPDTRTQALREGQKLLEQGCMGSNYLYFYRFAMDACLNAQEWQEIEKYAQALDKFTQAEPLPWSDFFTARARVLASFSQGARDDATMQTLKRVRDDGTRMGYKSSLSALEEALASV